LLFARQGRQQLSLQAIAVDLQTNLISRMIGADRVDHVAITFYDMIVDCDDAIAHSQSGLGGGAVRSDRQHAHAAVRAPAKRHAQRRSAIHLAPAR